MWLETRVLVRSLLPCFKLQSCCGFQSRQSLLDLGVCRYNQQCKLVPPANAFFAFYIGGLGLVVFHQLCAGPMGIYSLKRHANQDSCSVHVVAVGVLEIINITPSVPNYRSFWQIQMHNFCHASRHIVYLGAQQNLYIQICQNDLQFGMEGVCDKSLHLLPQFYLW